MKYSIYIIINSLYKLTHKDHKEKSISVNLDLEEVLHDKDTNLLNKPVHLFLEQSAISGVQPKVLAQLKDKATLSQKEYIIKSFSDEYPHLAENEYFCRKALAYAGVTVPRFWLSDNKKLFIMEKFTYKKHLIIFMVLKSFVFFLG